MDAILERLVELNHRTLAEIGDILDVVAFGDDVGQQDRAVCSLSLYRKLFRPHQERIVQTIRAHTKAKILYHTCGSVQQVKIASAARYLISNHGAGLTNMLFMRPGGSVLELRHNTDRINNCYFTLASALNHRYFYQTCAPENRDEDPHNANLFVDVAALRANLKLMLQP
jgi:hypothetical protein